jgi:hypothetical protein
MNHAERSACPACGDQVAAGTRNPLECHEPSLLPRRGKHLVPLTRRCAFGTFGIIVRTLTLAAWSGAGAACAAPNVVDVLLLSHDKTQDSIATTPEYLIGAYYFSGWWRKQPNKWIVNGQDWRKDWPGRVPTLGEYNEQETMDREIAAAADHGMHFFQILWYPSGGTSPQDWSADPLNAGLRQFMASTNRHRMNFTLEFVNHPPFDLAKDDAWKNACREWTAAMKDPGYLRVGGRPVFKIHGLQHFLNQNGGDVRRVAERLRVLREIAQESGLPNPLISGGVVPSEARTIGAAAEPYDFLTTYMDMPGLPKVEKPYPYSLLLAHAEQAWKSFAEKCPRPYVPYLPAGWDPRPWKDPRPSFDMPTRGEWQMSLRKIKEALDANQNLGVRLKGSHRQKMLLIYAWNEFGEGGIVAPTHGDGMMKLQAIRQVFGSGHVWGSAH